MKIDLLNKTDVNPIVQAQISNLFQQLGGNKTQISLTNILDGKNQMTLAYCKDNNNIIGIALMGNYNVISGKKGWIEDVVVNSKYRGQGIGRQLINKLIEVGKEKNLSEILLFTEDHRTPAIKLYTNMGFKIKDTRVYTKKMT